MKCQTCVVADRDFIEQRRRALRRFMLLVVRHPVLTDDAIVRYFLTFKGSVSTLACLHCSIKAASTCNLAIAGLATQNQGLLQRNPR